MGWYITTCIEFQFEYTTFHKVLSVDLKWSKYPLPTIPTSTMLQIVSTVNANVSPEVTQIPYIFP